MKLNTVKSLAQAQNVYQTSNFNSLSNLKPLSSAEENLIQEQFPQGQNKRLELYLSNGSSRMEIPEAKGRNLDFRI